MNEEFVKNNVMKAKIGVKVVMTSPYSKLVDGTSYSPATNIYWNNLWTTMNRGC